MGGIIGALTAVRFERGAGLVPSVMLRSLGDRDALPAAGNWRSTDYARGHLGTDEPDDRLNERDPDAAYHQFGATGSPRRLTQSIVTFAS